MILLIILSALAVSLPNAFESGPVWPDGERYTFNGILIHDMIRDGGFSAPYKYAVDFYVRYPATNLPYGPPFLAIIFAAFFSVFGISFAVARFIIAFFTVCAGLMCFFFVLRTRDNLLQAILAVSALLFNPLTGIYARDIVPELPVAFFSFLTLYCFYHYVEEKKKMYGIFAALALGLGYLTKPYIIPLGLILPVYIFVFRKWHIFLQKETYIASSIFLFLVLPQTFLAYKFATNELGAIGVRSNVPVEILSEYALLLIKHLPVIVIVSVVGFISDFIRKEKINFLCFLWFISAYLFFTLNITNAIDNKYLFSIAVALLIPFSTGAYYIITSLKKWRLDKIALIMLSVWFVYSAISSPLYCVTGHEKAGEYVAEHPFGKSVLYYGSYNGTFMMALRRHNPGGGPFILRGDRQLAVRVSYGNAKEHSIVDSSDEIISILKKYDTGYVVVEKDAAWAQKFPEYILLLNTVNNKKLFMEVKRFPIRSNYSKLGTELIIYKTLFDFSNKSTKTKFTVPVPTLNRNLETVIH